MEEAVDRRQRHEQDEDEGHRRRSAISAPIKNDVEVVVRHQRGLKAQDDAEAAGRLSRPS